MIHKSSTPMNISAIVLADWKLPPLFGWIAFLGVVNQLEVAQP